MEIREELSLQLDEGLQPAQLCAFPAQGCLVVVGSSGEVQTLDLASRTRPGPEQCLSSRLLCCRHERSGKLVMVGGGRLGSRRPLGGGSVMVKTLLQSTPEDMDDPVSIELPLSEAEVLWNELEKQVLPRHSDLPGSNSKQLTSQLASVTAQLAREVRRALDNQPTNKWCTVSFEGPIQQLFSLFDSLLARLRTQGTSSSSSFAAPSPALPVVAAVCLRLRLLHPDLCTPLRQLAEGREMKEQKLATCEAVRRLSLKKWPHSDYIWAVPPAMAEAGFFQVTNVPPHLATSAMFKGDRVTCFACHVYLYNWESHDEPWSEHERHAFMCPYMRGDPTENVPLEVTEGSHPAVQVTAESADEIISIAVSPHSNLVAVATKHGLLSLWDVSGSLCILPYAHQKLERKNLLSLQDTHSTDGGRNDEITGFSITSLSLLSYPEDDSPTTLITAVSTTGSSGSTHSFILVHSVLAPPTAPQDLPTPTPHEGGATSQLEPLLESELTSLSDNKPSYMNYYSFTPPPLPHLPTSTEDTSSTAQCGSLTLLSLLPISTILPGLHGNLEVAQTYPLPMSRLLAMYAQRPHPPEVKGDTNEGPIGYLVMLKCGEEEEGGVASVPVVRRVITQEEEGITDMCHVAVGMKEMLVVVTTGGDVHILDVSSLQVVGVHRCVGGRGFSRCTAWSSSTGSWVAMVTREGRVEVVRVCEVGTEGGGEGETHMSLIRKCEGERLSCCLLDQLLSLTETSPVGVVFSALAPPQWREISLQRFNRKVPIHMHSGRGSQGDTTARVWQFLPPSPSTSQPISGDFTFEVSLPSSCPPLGCVSVCLSLPSPRCIGDSATLSLLLPTLADGGGGRGTQFLCGPISLSPLVDVTGCAVQVSLTHPLLLSPPPPSLLLIKLDNLFPTDYSTVVMATAEAHSPTPTKVGGVRRRGCVVRHVGGTPYRLHHTMTGKTGKTRAVPDQCYLSLSLFPLSLTASHNSSRQASSQDNMAANQDKNNSLVQDNKVPDVMQPSMRDVLKLKHKRNFILNLVLGACGYRVVEQELGTLPQSLHTLVVEGGGEREGRGVQVRCLRLLCWLSHLTGGVPEREEVEMMRGGVSQLVLSLLHGCYLASNSRQTAHSCSRLVISLFSPEEHSQSSSDFTRSLLRAFPLLLPLLPLSPSAACAQWLLRIVSMVVTRSHDSHVILQQCLVVLVQLARQLESKSGALSQQLHANYSHAASVLDQHLYDVPLSYYQKSSVSLASLTEKTSSTPAPPPPLNPYIMPPFPFPYVDTMVPPPQPLQVPPGVAPGGPNPTPQNGGPSPQVVVTDRKHHTIYDAELKLLLGPAPSSPPLARKAFAEFPPFHHGSFLLYSQRGLLETFPLEYSCYSVTPDASVREPTYRSLHSLSSPSPSSSLPLTEKTKISGYFYPSSQSGAPSSHSSTLSYRTPSSCPNDLVKSEIIPRELVMVIDSLQSGKVYSAVLKFNGPVYLTDLSISTSYAVGCVSVEVWGGEGGEGGAVRLAQSAEIQERNLMLGNLSPPPLCQFVRVTYTGRLGAAREKAQMFLGAFYGVPLLPASRDPQRSNILGPLEGALLFQYQTTRQDLVSVLETVSGGGDSAREKDRVREKYQACFLAQTRLARLRHYMETVGGAPVVIGGVFSLQEAAAALDYSSLSRSQLYRLAGCLVNAMLILTGPREEKEDTTSVFTAPLSWDQVPTVTEEECQLLLSSLCVHGVQRLQARTCSLLLRLCGAQPWWGEMVVSTASRLFSSEHNTSFNKKRVILQLSALCQRSYQQSSVITSLLHTLSSLLPPSSAPTADTQLHWLLLLLSHSLSSLHSSPNDTQIKDPHLFTPALTALSTPTDSKKTTVFLRKPRADQSLPNPPPPLSLPYPLTHSVVRGLLIYCLSLSEQGDWLQLPMVCKVVSILAELSSAPLPLPSLLTSSQLTHLLSTALSPLPRPSPSNDPSNQRWACQAVSWMVMSLVYFGHMGPPVERGREDEKVEKVMENSLPVKEEAVVVDRETEKENGKPQSMSLHTDEWGFPQHPTPIDLDLFLLDDLKTMLQPFPSFPGPPQLPLVTPHLPVPPSQTFGTTPFHLPPHVYMATAPPSTTVLKSSSLSPPLPPPVPSFPLFHKPHHKQRKKQLKHYHVKSSKYAPGDYTEYPDPAPNSASKSSAVNPYRSFLISSCVDQRLTRSLDYPTELALQNIARYQYEAVLRSIATAGPSSGATPREEEVEKENVRGEGALDDARDLVCESLDHLLQLAQGPQPNVALVNLLIFWSEMNSLLFPAKKPLQLAAGRPVSLRSLSSPNLLGTLVRSLSHTPSGHTSSNAATWQIGFSLLQQLCSSHPSSLPLSPSQLSQLLTAFMSSEELPNVGVARGVVSEFLKTLLELDLTGEEGEEGKEGVKGIHVVFEVLVKILEERPAVLNSPVFHTLVKTVNEESVLGALFPAHPAPCRVAVSCVLKLLEMMAPLILSTHLSAVSHNVALYAADIDPTKYRYRNSGTSNLKWQHLPLDNTDPIQGLKVIVDLIQFVRKVLFLSKGLPCEVLGRVMKEMGLDAPSCPSLPLASLLHGNSTLLKDYLSILADPALSHTVPRPPGKTPLPPKSPLSELATLLHTLYEKCDNLSTFHGPLLSVLHSAPLPTSLPPSLLSFFSGVVTRLSIPNRQEQLELFLRDGGARGVLECLIKSCQDSSSSLGDTLLQVGQQQPSGGADSTHLVNYLPLANLDFTPGHAPLTDLQSAQMSDAPSRSSAFHHTFQSGDRNQEVVISATLPHPILLRCIQLFQPLGLLQNGPSSILVEVSAQPKLAPPTPATPSIHTSGLGCVKIEFQSPVVAREVRVHLRRPAVSDSISLSHMCLLGVGYGVSPPGGTTGGKSSEEESSHPCSYWLEIVDKWHSNPALLDEASRVPQLVPTYLSLISTQHNTLSIKGKDQAMCVLVSLSQYSPDVSHTIVTHLMGLARKATPTATPHAVELLHCLCVPDTEESLQRCLLCVKQLSALTDSHSPILPVLVRALASSVWRGDSKLVSSHLPEDLFSSLAEATISLPMDSPLRQSLISFLCSLCSHTLHHFSLLVERCQTSLASSPPPLLPPHLPPLLSTLSQVAHSLPCSSLLLSAPLLPSLLTELCETFTKLASQTTQQTLDKETPLTWSTTLPRACALLAFLTDFARDWCPAKDWLGGEGRSHLWPHLLQFLCLAESHPRCPLSPLELGFVQDVGLEFFRCVVQDSANNKTIFCQLLTNALTGSISVEPHPASRPTPFLTHFTHRLVVDLVLVDEPCTILVKQISRHSVSPFPLPFSYASPLFHPCLPVARDSFLLSLPRSLPLSHLASLCIPPSNTRSKVTTSNTSQPTKLSTGAKPTPTQLLVQPPAPPAHKKSSVSSHKSNVQEAKKIFTTSSSLFFSATSSGHPLSPQATLSEVLCLTPSNPTPSLSLFARVSRDNLSVGTHDVSQSDRPHSLLETFALCGGLSLLSLCLPSLHPSFWPAQQEPHTPPSLATPRPFSLPSPPHTPSPHSLITLGLCLRLRCYGDFLLKHQQISRTLLLMLLGAEYKDTVTPEMMEELPYVPYLVLLQLLAEKPEPNEVGVACREGVMRGGVLHQLLSSLSALGHRPRATPTSYQDSASSEAVSRPDQTAGGGMESGHNNRLYWAKGTGFGTGSTTSEWNVDAMRAKQKSEERHVWLVFAILWECLGEGAESWFDSGLADTLASSCLLPALATYLVNDSILDIAKHMELYLAALGVLYSLTLHPSLLPLLTLPVFPTGGDPPPMTSSSDTRGGLTLLSLAKRLKITVLSYSRTARLKTVASVCGKTTVNGEDKTTPTNDENATPSSGENATPTREEQLPPKLPQKVRLKIDITGSQTQTKDERLSAEEELTELTSAMLVTAESVLFAVSELGEGGGGEEGEGGGGEATEVDEYMRTMSSLQFDTYPIVEEEDEGGKLSVSVPFHYESRLQPSGSASYSPARARRLAQEVSALATSLPLSSNSSVFVRCDENRLDVMKVLITGPSDTPYANGCFEFDVLFPEEYPKGPMLVNLLTTGQGTVRFNPNLYNDGKVCLSVLNTWHGRPEEKWNSETSSFLQVLVSIQSLVLVPDPYFNEPGYEQYRGTPYGDQKSLTYNANLYVATVRWAMIHQLQNPSPCFREVVLKHFHLRRREVLRQCQSWVRSLAEGIKKMQSRGMATAPLTPLLHKLVKNVETLRTEIGKIERKLGGSSSPPGGGAMTSSVTSLVNEPDTAVEEGNKTESSDAQDVPAAEAEHTDKSDPDLNRNTGSGQSPPDTSASEVPEIRTVPTAAEPTQPSTRPNVSVAECESTASSEPTITTESGPPSTRPNVSVAECESTASSEPTITTESGPPSTRPNVSVAECESTASSEPTITTEPTQPSTRPNVVAECESTASSEPTITTESGPPSTRPNVSVAECESTASSEPTITTESGATCVAEIPEQKDSSETAHVTTTTEH